MASPHDSKFLDDPEFQSLLVACMESLQRGETIDREALAKDFPKFAAEVAQFLNDRQLLERVASEFDDVEPSQVAIAAYEKTMSSSSGSDDFTAGDTIRYIGEYEILEEIARGGMGVVFKARQQKLKRIVALKMILAGRLADTSDVERFQREARAAGRLKHVNIVPVHEIGEHEGRHYFTMDFVEGHSLAESIREGTLAPRTAAALVRTAAEAVQYAHEQGTVHRDLKPANVLLDTTGQPQITDFGLAKLLESVDEESRAELTASGQILGTPSYMSPEQAAGNQNLVGPASDIYSLGAILYACLTGRAPFVADSPVDTLLQVMRREPVSPRILNPAVPKDLETICLKCLTKEPQKRYGTAQELADDLNRYLEGRPVVARPIGAVSRTVRWCRRNKVVASLLSLVFLSMAAGTVVSAFYANTASRHAKSEEHQRRDAELAREEAEKQRDAAERARQLTEKSSAELRHQLYVAQMPRALKEWKDGNTAGVRQLLEQHNPEDGKEDLRGFEWHWLDNLTRSSKLTIDTGRKILDADIDPTGQIIATIGDRRVLIHRLDTGQQVEEFRVPYSGLAGVEFDSTGQFLAVGHDAVQLWDIREKTLAWESEPEPGVIWVEFTSNDHLIVSLSNNWKNGGSSKIRVRDRKSGALIREISAAKTMFAADLNPPGTHIATTGYDNQISVWDIHSGRKLKGWSCKGAVFALSYSPDGHSLICGNLAGSLERHDPIAGKLVDDWGKQPTPFRFLASDADGQRFAGVGASQIAHVFNWDSGELSSEFRGHAAEIVVAQFRPNSQDLVTCDRIGIVHVWDSRHEQGFVRFHGDLIDLSSAAFSPDGRWLARAEGISWRMEQKGKVRLNDLRDGTDDLILDGHQEGVFGVAIANKRIFSIGHEGNLVTWDLDSFAQLETRSFDRPLTALAISEDGQIQALGTGDGVILVKNDESGDGIAEFPVGDSGFEVVHAAISPDGRFVAGHTRRDLRVWDWSRNRCVVEADNIEPGAIAFTASGNQMAAAADGNVQIYDTSTWAVIHELKAHSQPIRGIAFHPDGRQLATRSTDGTTTLWETETWQNVLTLPQSNHDRNDLFAPIFSPDGRLFLAGRNGEVVRFLSNSGTVREQLPLDPEYFRDRAYTFARQQKWPEAFDQYERLIEAGSVDRPWVCVHAAEIASVMEQTDATRRRIQESAKLATSFRDNDIFLAARLIQAAQLLPRMDPDPQTSLEITRQAWNEKGEVASGTLIHTLFRQQRYAELVDFMEENRGRLKTGTTTLLLHAGALYRLGRVDEASVVLSGAAERYGNDMPPIGRDRFLESMSSSTFISNFIVWSEVSEIAIESLNKAITDRPDSAALRAHRGLLHRRWHRWSDAFDDLRMALELDPDNVDYLEAATVCAVLAGELESADRLATQLVNHFRGPDGISSIWFAARIAALLPSDSCMDEDLLRLVRASASAEPEHSWRQVATPGVLHRLGRLENAMEELDRIEAAFPDHDAAAQTFMSFRRGIILYEQGKIDEAVAALRSGEAISRTWLQPPGVFRQKGRHSLVEGIVLHRELTALIESRDETQSANASKETEPQPLLLDRLGAEDPDVRIETLQELMRLNADAVFALPVLLEMLKKPVSNETALVIRCLGNIGPQAAEAVPRLDEILKGHAEVQSSDAANVSESHEQRIGVVPVSGIRFDAAAAMARMGPLGEVAIPTLIEMLEKPGESVKTWLDGKRVGAPEAEGYAALLYRRDETGFYVDQRDRDLINVIRCLANFGPAAKDAAPAIEAVGDDPDTLSLIVEMATETLMAIQSDGKE